jgi:hypothetical protein
MLAKWPPLKLAQLAFAGSLVFALAAGSGPAADGLAKLHDHFSLTHRIAFAVTTLLLAVLLPILIGSLLILVAKRRLFAGLNNDEWPEDEIEKARVWVASPGLKRIAKGLQWTAIALWVASVGLFIWKYPPGPTLRLVTSSLIFLTIPVTTLSKLRGALRPDPPPYDPSKSWTAGLKPLHSEQWGTRDLPNAGRSEA